MKCPEYVRLRLLYEAAFQHWGHTLLSSEGTELLGAPARQAAALKHKALVERDAAMERVRVHERSCPVCRKKSAG
jgi:hypothetical protein